MDEIISSPEAYQFFAVVLLLVPLLFLVLRNTKSLSSTDPPLPPGPRPWPIIGNLLNLGTKPHRSLAKLSQTHGPLISLKLGSQIIVVGSSPTAAREILKTHDRVCSGRHVPHAIHAKSPETNPLSLVWASECTEQWKFLRTICRTEVFSSKAIESQANLRENKVKEMIDFLGVNKGKEVKIVEFAFTTIINVISGICFSKDFIDIYDQEQVGGLKGHIRKIMEVGSLPNLADYFTVLSGLDLQGLHKKFLECVTSLFAQWDVLIDARRQGEISANSTQKDLVDVLLANEFSNNRINHLIFDLFVAGSDSTSSTVEWLMAELIKNEKAMNKVQEELAREISEGLVKDSDLPRLTYLNACVKETLRLHPPAPIVPRRALETCIIMNYTIPEDSRVIVNLWALGRDPGTWEDPLAFNPSRFLGSDLDFKGNDFELVPFSAGRRICPGYPLASKMIHLIVASMVHCFDWSLPDNQCAAKLDMNEKFGITLLKEQPLTLIPRIKE